MPSHAGVGVLHMPEPVRTMPSDLRPLLCAEEPAEPGSILEGVPVLQTKDPYGRHPPKAKEDAWSVEPLAKIMKGAVSQIDGNLQKYGMPSPEKLDSFISRLVSKTKESTNMAPKDAQRNIRRTFASCMQPFWDVAHNQKIKDATPDELKVAISHLIEHVNSEFSTKSGRSGRSGGSAKVGPAPRPSAPAPRPAAPAPRPAAPAPRP